MKILIKIEGEDNIQNSLIADKIFKVLDDYCSPDNKVGKLDQPFFTKNERLEIEKNDIVIKTYQKIPKI